MIEVSSSVFSCLECYKFNSGLHETLSFFLLRTEGRADIITFRLNMKRFGFRVATQPLGQS
jgi:hypothetical protein